MAYKRQIDRLPIIPADAKEHNVVCHYCIVGCGYKAYTWDIDKQGTTDPAGNKFGIDLAKQQGAETEAQSMGVAPEAQTDRGTTAGGAGGILTARIWRRFSVRGLKISYPRYHPWRIPPQSTRHARGPGR